MCIFVLYTKYLVCSGFLVQDSALQRRPGVVVDRPDAEVRAAAARGHAARHQRDPRQAGLQEPHRGVSCTYIER